MEPKDLDPCEGEDLFGLYVTNAVFSKEGNGLVAVILS